jgi:MOSC domain-containing protein YiiM
MGIIANEMDGFLKTNSGMLEAVCISEEKGTQKADVRSRTVLFDAGLEGDAHAGFMHRQVSLLASESIDEMRAKGLTLEAGAFGENLVTSGIELKSLNVGDRLRVGNEVLLEVTQIGKECVSRCAIYYLAGDCIMPREGIFARVLQGGRVETGDGIEVWRKGYDEGV